MKESLLVRIVRSVVALSSAAIPWTFDRVALGQGTELQEVLPNLPEGFENFGVDVAIDGDRLVVGAYQSDKGQADAGRVLVFRFDGTNWIEEFEILNPSPQAHDEFGRSVALSGDVIVVGAPGDDSLATDAGAIYAYRFDGTKWKCEGKFVMFDGAAGDNAGTDVSVSGDRFVVGVASHDESSTVTNSGSAWVYRYEPMLPGWILEKELFDPSPQAGARFGEAVSIQDDVVAVGVPRHDEMPSTEVGAVFVFRRANSWAFEGPILASVPTTGAQLGVSVCIDHDQLAAGASSYDHSPSLFDSGAACVFQYASGTWTQQAFLETAQPSTSGFFGNAVAIRGHALAVGAVREANPSPPLSQAGAVYLYFEAQGAWLLDSRLVSNQLQSIGLLGASVDLDSRHCVAGSPTQDVNGNSDAGAVQVFGGLDLGLDVVPRDPVVGGNVTVTMTYADPGTLGLLSVIEVNGTQTWAPLGIFPFNAQQRLDLAAVVPVGLSGVAVTLLGFGIGVSGHVVASPTATLSVH